MPDVFTRTEVDFGGAMHAQNGIIVPNAGLTGVLMQNIQLSYQQAVTRIYELGKRGQKTKVYYIGGRSQGTLGAAHVIGPGISMKAFYDNFGDVCKAKNNTCVIDLAPNICQGQGSANVKYTAKYCVLVSIGVSVAAQDFVVNENSQMMFSGLEFQG
jgi:hypothetical protein